MMMTRKAIYNGECQICGRIQKLPVGQMAKHGYTVDWGFFNGVCSGSNNLPFEQDKSLVDEAIRGATVHQEYLVKRIGELREDTNPAKAYVRFWSSTEGKYKQSWVDTNTIVKGGDPITSSGRHSGQWVAQVTDRAGKTYEAIAAIAVLGYCFAIPTAIQAAYQCNARLARDMEQNELYGVTRYIAWQNIRVENWAVKPLRTI